MDLQVVFVIDMISDEVVDVIDVDFVSEPLAEVFWNLGKEIEGHNEVVACLKGLGSYTKNPCKLHVDLKIKKNLSPSPQL